MMVLGLVVASEALYMFIGNMIWDNKFAFLNVVNMYTGWGMRNNIAAQICICITVNSSGCRLRDFV